MTRSLFISTQLVHPETRCQELVGRRQESLHARYVEFDPEATNLQFFRGIQQLVQVA